MKALKWTLAAALVAGSVMAFGTTARADVVCNGAGDCWNANEHYAYPPDVHVQVFPDTWRHEHEHDSHYRWLENHQGRGYYNEKGDWHPF